MSVPIFSQFGELAQICPKNTLRQGIRANAT